MLTAVLITALAQVAGFENPAAWEPVSSENGLTLERRPIVGSSSLEYRVTARTSLSVDTMCDAVFEWGTRGKDVSGLKARREISAQPDERVVYDQFEQPIVSNRDYAMIVRRSHEAPDTCRIRFWASPDKSVPPLDGWVRLTKMWGSWSFSPTHQSATLIVYTLFADPGGSIPAFLANGSQRDAALASVRKALEKGQAWKH